MTPDRPQQANYTDDTVDLLLRARAGDGDALNRLFDHHIPILRRWASGRLPRWARDAADTSDLVQETVVQTLKHLDTFEPRGEGALQAYLRQAVIRGAGALSSQVWKRR
jgi:DNA-directed RNA polymerase specialized sigma24 family protein